jgi:hypothetical protein
MTAIATATAIASPSSSGIAGMHCVEVVSLY